jgi:putative transposase
LPFAGVDSARHWVAWFVDWYNRSHRTSAIQYVTPDQRHFGDDYSILARRHELYQRAQSANPGRWSGATRNWTPVASVVLDPTPVPSGPAEETTRQ